MKMPASFAEFSDALQKARIKDGSFCKNELTCIHYNGLTHAMIVWYLTIPVIRKYKEIPVLIVTVALALIAGYFKNIGDFLCMSRILVFGPFFYLGYYMEQPVLERALRPVYRRVVVPAAVAICAGILAFGSKLKDELGMVYENISYYELDDVWEGPFVRLALMIAAFLISWAIMFFVPRGKTCLSVIGQNTMPVYMLHRILRDILMFEIGRASCRERV